LSGRGLCDELITRPEESYRLCCVVCNLETSRIGAPYIYDISNLRVKVFRFVPTVSVFRELQYDKRIVLFFIAKLFTVRIFVKLR